MSARKILTVLIFTALFSILCFSMEQPPFQQAEPANLPYAETTVSANQYLGGSPNPALVGFSALRIVLLYQNVQLEEASVTFSEIATRVQQRVARTDYRLAILLERGYAARFEQVPTLTVNIDNLYLAPDRPPVYIVKTSFSNSITPLLGTSAVLQIELWSRTDTIEANNIDTWTIAVESLINHHMEEFTKDFIRANTRIIYPQIRDANSPVMITPRPLDSNSVSMSPASAQVEAQKTAQQVEYQYVGSKASGVFHKPDCPWVKNILPKNFVIYATRQEALDAGKRPCKTCNP